MQPIKDGFWEILQLIKNGDPELYQATFLTLLTSGSAILLACIIGVPSGILLGLSRFPGRKLLVTLINTGMGFPPVLVGLFVFLLLYRDGPLGDLKWLYTPAAMITAQVIIAVPLVIGVTLAAIGSLEKDWFLQVRSLGASYGQTLLLLLKETRLGLAAAMMAGLGRILAEVGAVMMVGGNLKGETRVLTTSILMWVQRGDYELAIALGIFLLGIAFIANLCLTLVQQRAKERRTG